MTKSTLHGFCIGLFTSTTCTKWQKVVSFGVVTNDFILFFKILSQIENNYQIYGRIVQVTTPSYEPFFSALFMCYVEVTHVGNATPEMEFGKVRYKNTSKPP